MSANPNAGKTMMHKTLITMAALAALFSPAAHATERQASKYFDSVADEPAFLRAFLKEFPKGGDLHSHLSGAVYGERFLRWAAEDGLCVSPEGTHIAVPEPGTACAANGSFPASDVAADADRTDTLIDALSMRSFVPSPGWSGHDQFFSTFAKMDAEPKRFGDSLAAISARAGAQNILYLELMRSLNQGALYGAAMQTPWDGAASLEAMHARLMAGPLGQNWDDIVAEAKASIDRAEIRRRALLGCETGTPDPGCEVEIRFLYQVIRVGPLSGTFAGFMLGFELAQSDPRVVGINLVAPEDHPTAIANYTLNMQMIDFLWQRQGPIDISLHAGELTLGLVPPSDLSFHIRQAIDIGHAKRIGHGIDINYERDMPGLLEQMRKQDILVEINLTSNDVILGVKGDAHPFNLYRSSGVPLALSTDDEGVSRIDLTHEYQRAVETYGLTYAELKSLSRNSLTYSFLNASDKARLLSALDQRFKSFEADIGKWPVPKH
jgi:adenosine deaminase